MPYVATERHTGVIAGSPREGEALPAAHGARTIPGAPRPTDLGRPTTSTGDPGPDPDRHLGRRHAAAARTAHGFRRACGEELVPRQRGASLPRALPHRGPLAATRATDD